MPNLSFTKPKGNRKGKNTAQSLTGPESSTSLAPHASPPVRSASPSSMFERIRSLGKKSKEKDSAHPGLAGAASPIRPHTHEPIVSATGRRLLDPPDQNHQPLLASNPVPKSLPEQRQLATTEHDQVLSSSPHILVSASDQGHVKPPHASSSPSAQTNWKSNIIKYSKATFKVLGELTGVPLVGNFIEEMEVSIFTLSRRSTHCHVACWSEQEGP